MSAVRELMPYQQAMANAKPRFTAIADLRRWDKESVFAMQALMKTDFAMNTANKNPTSVQLAMINVASTGLTLNPANAYAYLVPRDGAIVLDISYKGLIKIATDAGSIMWARADIVRESDQFTYNGPAAMPEHKTNPFAKDRGAIVGAYVIAKTPDGDILTDVIDLAELEKIRGKSMAYTKSKSGPWVEWFEQMAKKALVKRASKMWPYTDRMDKLHDVIEQQNEIEGGYEMEGHAVQLVSAEQAENIRLAAADVEMDMPALLRLFNVEEVEAIPSKRYVEVMKTIEEASHAGA